MNNELKEKMNNLNKNLIIEGDLSTGKTVNIGYNLFENSIKNEDNIFVLDSKKEYINKYQKDLKDHGYRTIVINIKDIEKTEFWNPLELAKKSFDKKNEDIALEYIKAITDNVFFEPNSPDPFWAMTANDFSTGLIMSLLENGKDNQINLDSLSNMLEYGAINNDKNKYLTEYFNTLDKDSTAAMFLSATITAPQETRGSITTTARQKFMPLIGYKSLNKILSKNTFEFSDLINYKTAILFIGDDKYSNTNKLSAIFITQLYTLLTDSKVKRKFNFIIDNFDTIKEFPNLDNLLSNSLSNNILINIITRDIEILYDHHGTYLNKLANIITVNDDIIIYNDTKYDITKIENNINDEYNYTSNKITENEIFNISEYVENNVDMQEKRKLELEDLIKTVDKKIELLKNLNNDL